MKSVSPESIGINDDSTLDDIVSCLPSNTMTRIFLNNGLTYSEEIWEDIPGVYGDVIIYNADEGKNGSDRKRVYFIFMDYLCNYLFIRSYNNYLSTPGWSNWRRIPLSRHYISSTTSMADTKTSIFKYDRNIIVRYADVIQFDFNIKPLSNFTGSGTVIGVIPEGYRPAYYTEMQFCTGGLKPMYVSINPTNGNVILTFSTTINANDTIATNITYIVPPVYNLD